MDTMDIETPVEAGARHAIQRVRHDHRMRLLTVGAVERLTPYMVRVRLQGDLAGFVSASPDDHIKLIFGPPPAEGERPVMRDFTPRRFDVAAGTLEIDFALHEAGPATDWASNAHVGDTLRIAGPRGSVVIADDFDWYLLIGDETALPAIGRRIEAAAPGARITAVVGVTGAAEEQSFATAAELSTAWIHRPAERADDPAPYLPTLDAALSQPGDGLVWIAAEGGVVRALKAEILRRGHPEAWIKASGYWKRGEADKHENL